MPAGGWDGGAGVRSLAERSRAQKDALVDAFYHIKDSVRRPVFWVWVWVGGWIGGWVGGGGCWELECGVRMHVVVRGGVWWCSKAEANKCVI